MRLRDIIMTFALTAASVSCTDLKFGNSFLEKAPGVDVTIDTIFSSKLYADRALTAAYECMRSGLNMHNNLVNGEHLNYFAEAKLGADSMDSITDIIQSACDWGGMMATYYQGEYSSDTENGKISTKFCFDTDRTMTWKGVRRSWLYIENVDKVPDMTAEEKARRKAECRCIIASCYLDALRNIGGVPIMDHAMSASDLSGYDRKTVEQVLDFIIDQIELAEDDLPWVVTSEEDGHWNRAAAKALKIRALLFAASPLFNSDQPYMQPQSARGGNIQTVIEDPALMIWLGGYDATRWQDVADACQEWIDENIANGEPYRLIQSAGTTCEDYREAFRYCYFDRHNGEIIMPTGRMKKTLGDTYHYYYFGSSYEIYPDGGSNDGRGYGGGNMTLNFVDIFPNADGTPSSYRKWCQEHQEVVKTTDGRDTTVYRGSIDDTPWNNKDPRLYETVNIVGDHFRDRRQELWIGGTERREEGDPRGTSGFTLRKFIWDYTVATCGSKPCNYPYIRLSEIFLSYAEALNELGRSGEAYQWLNRTRRRVGLPDMDDALLARVQPDSKFIDDPEIGQSAVPAYSEPLSGNVKLREEILEERMRELCFEECRWYDVARWKRSDVFTKTLYGITIRAEKVESTYPGAYMQDNNNTVFVYGLRFSEPEILKPVRYWTVEARDKGFQPKWFLSAFPSNEVNKGYGLIQNPGW